MIRTNYMRYILLLTCALSLTGCAWMRTPVDGAGPSPEPYKSSIETNREKKMKGYPRNPPMVKDDFGRYSPAEMSGFGGNY